MGRNELLTNGYYKVALSEKEAKKEYALDKEFLKKAMAYVEQSDMVTSLRNRLLETMKQKKY